MRSCLLLLSCIYFCNAFAQTDEQQLEKALSGLPNVSFKKVSTAKDAPLQYDLLVKQPLDHDHPEKGFFDQRVVLTHRGFGNATVMETEGYWLFPFPNEIEKILNANNLQVEYRYCGKSLPDTMQWEYLTVEQAAADLHAINQLFRKIYTGKFVSTGISKGGSTTIYYKYFYPADVDLSIPYVAPLDNSLEDKRIYTFLDTIGPAECRKKIFQFQTFLLQHENEALEKLKWYSKGANLTYNYTGSLQRSFEYAVLEYSFAFWQYNDDCGSIPINQSLEDHLAALLKTSDIAAFADEGIKMFEAHYYQAATQCGYYGYNIQPFRKYIHSFTSNPSAALPPKAAAIKPFDGSLNAKVAKWLAESGNNIIYIYGAMDTWSAAGVVVSDKVNSKRFNVPKANHSTARIENMDAAMQQEFAQAVKKMAGADVEFGALK